MIIRRTLLFVAVISLALCSKAVYGQGSSGSILAVDLENFVLYFQDTSDLSKFATDANPTAAAVPRNFYSSMQIADIVAVNGQPAKGTVTFSAQRVNFVAIPNPGQAIADTVRTSVVSDGVPRIVAS